MKSPKLFFAWLMIWAAPAMADGNMRDGLDAEQRGDYLKALAEYQPLAVAGNAEAQYHMGLLSFRSTSRDTKVALRWLTDSANQGYAPAQARLGTMYVRGDSVPRDIATGISWMTKAAQQGLGDAQVSLGITYWDYLQPPDFDKAAYWFEKAAEQGDARGQSNLAGAYMRGQGVPKDAAKGIYWYRNAAEQGYPDAEFALGLAYQYGTGVPKDDALAVSWYRKGVAQGNLRSMLSLGAFYANGWSVPKDEVAALALFDLSVDKLIRTDPQAGDQAAANRMLLLKLVTDKQVSEGKTLAADMQRGDVLATLDAYIQRHQGNADGTKAGR